MRTLVPASDTNVTVDLHEAYAEGWLDSAGLRVNFVASADGAISAAGRSRGLQTPGDNAIFATLRDIADVVFIGAGTARTEGYTALQQSARRQDIRTGYGLAAHLPIALVSNSLGLDPSTELFTGAHPDARTMVFTSAAADPGQRTELAAVADIIVCGSDAVDLAEVRRALEERGLRRILCEGGPTLFAGLARAGLVDEVCLSITPLLAGPGSSRMTSGPEWPGDPCELDLIGLLEEDGALFTRYRVRAPDQ
jgi:riboflavin biosynthesis pyrimidine reductase